MSSCITARVTYAEFPIEECLERPEESALAIISGTEGPAYRPVGAAMLVRNGQVVAGTLSSGCIEKDIALHAMDCLGSRQGRTIRYGAGSPYMDIRLPCGGALDVTVIPRPDFGVLQHMRVAKSERRGVTLDLVDGKLQIAGQSTGKDILQLRVEPDHAFHVFGKGPEAETFSAMASAAGYATWLYSPDPETLDAAATHGVSARHLVLGRWPQEAVFDRFSAVVLFFHDHDWEPPILKAASASEAFYIGAQGSRRTRAKRDQMLEKLGLPPEEIARMKGPIGVIRHARDPRTLAISVLCEIVNEASICTAPAT